MFRDWRFGTAFALEFMLPWLVMVSGFPAIYFFFEADRIYREQFDSAEYQVASGIFHSCYDMAMVTGTIVVILELLLGLVALVILIISLVKKSGVEYSICRPLTVFVCSFPCVFGSLFLMFLVNAFTYGMGV